jgi:hypothetical protein
MGEAKELRWWSFEGDCETCYVKEDGAMPVIDVGDRLDTALERLELAADVIGVMVHPRSKTDRRRRRTALARTILGMRDRDDEPDTLAQVRAWFQQAGSFKTDAEADTYGKQQNVMLQQMPKMLAVGRALTLVWAMDLHHRALPGGASLNKALAILQAPIAGRSMSERSLRSAWSRYKPVAHFCAGLEVAFRLACDGAPDEHEIDERMKHAYHEELNVTLSLVAAYERFATGFIPYSQSEPLLDPHGIWLLRGIEPHALFLPRPLRPNELTLAEAYQAPRNAVFR